MGTIDEIVCLAARFSPAGDRLLLVVDDPEVAGNCDTGNVPGRLQIWDVSDPSRPALEHVDTGAPASEAWWSPDGASYLRLTDRLDFVDADTHEPIWSHTFELPTDGPLNTFVVPTGALFRSDGGSVVVGTIFTQSAGSWLTSFDTATGAVIGAPTPTAALNSMNWWDEEETQVVGTLGPSGTTVLDLDSATEVLPAPVENRNATSVWVDRERERLVVSSRLGIEVFSLDGSSVLERRVGLTDEQLAVQAQTGGEIFPALSADGDRLLMSLQDPSVSMVEWDTTTDPATRTGERPPGFVLDQGDSTLFGDLAGVQVLDGKFEPVGVAVGYTIKPQPPINWRSSSDGSKHGPLRFDAPVLEIYDTLTGDLIEVDDLADVSEIGENEYSFSADGAYLLRWVITPDGERWAVFDTESGDVVHSGESEIRSDPVLAGRTIYSNAPNSFDLERRDVETLEIVGPPLVGHTLTINGISDDLDSDRIVTQARNGNVRVWDRETGDQIGNEIEVTRQQAGLQMSTSATAT